MHLPVPRRPAVVDGQELGLLYRAAFLGPGTARVEAASSRDVHGARRVPLEAWLGRPADLGEPRRRLQQHARVRRARVAVKVIALRHLGDGTEVHDGDPVGQKADDREVVRDQQDGEAQTVSQVVEQLQDGRLHRHVEGRDGLVGDEQAWLDGQRPRDGDPLPLSTGELVGVAVEGLGRHADEAHQLAAAGFDLVSRHEPVHAQQFGQDVAHREAGVQGRGRVLEHHLHRAPPLGGPAAG